MTVTLTNIRDGETLFHDDLARLAPGCDISIVATDTGFVATLTHRITRLSMIVRLGDGLFCLPDEWQVAYAGSTTSGRSAYGYDSAVTHHYRHNLDYTSEWGPGTAWDYSLHLAAKGHA